MKTYLLTFNTHFEALTAFKNAQKCEFAKEAKLIAVPRKISSSCGTALSINLLENSQLDNFEYDLAFECLGNEEFLEIK
ncbi:MAG: DUF3343 domain-containing protein [Treponemataceae bacterium]